MLITNNSFRQEKPNNGSLALEEGPRAGCLIAPRYGKQKQEQADDHLFDKSLTVLKWS